MRFCFEIRVRSLRKLDDDVNMEKVLILLAE